ncbi:phosphoribosylanthranilate isomerase [Draconibacterium halophilum]|uniref:N-(5'-phosphoribosyl)anthranilate isomerase n=1 Tax=Draconibacterium halophilum TaxID=2706887 RepID=A0A6C0RI83_9BACT|nr:phosphoribosylanthranilate isomerase [Draconibacterium halophilum]QIA09365.1 phosphoribosylanthranilate isomerase [Draconibacterium halophilum]
MAKDLKIKVCGMKFTQNREQVEALDVDLLGYIFYGPSKRFVGDSPDAGLFQSTKPKVGVFVNENAFEILGLAKNLGFDYVQLHGKENPKTCGILQDQDLHVLKAFPMDEEFNFAATTAFEESVDYFLFDTKTKQHGGSGKKFNWQLLENYKGETPFFLSGGIGSDDAAEIKELNHPMLAGVDLNSGFEDEPGLKNIEKLEKFIHQLKK